MDGCDELLPLTSLLLPSSDEENDAPPTNVVLRFTSSSCRAGMGIGVKKCVGNPSKSIVMVKFVLLDGMAHSHNIQPGMIVLGFVDTRPIIKRLKSGPFPFDLHFSSPATHSKNAGTYKSPTLEKRSNPLHKLSAPASFRPTEHEKRQIVKGFLSSTFAIVHSFLFGWINQAKSENHKACWCNDINSSLVSAALSNEMVKKVDEGLFQDALVIANEALTVQRRCEGSNNPDIGRILNFIGIILSQMEDSDTHNYMALTSFEESLTIMQETLGYGDEETSFALHNMWLLLHNERERLKEDEYERNEVHTYKGALPIEA